VHHVTVFEVLTTIMDFVLVLVVVNLFTARLTDYKASCLFMHIVNNSDST